MPSCSILQCSARKSKKLPNLSVHRVPKNQVLRKKWLDAIGPQNFNTDHKSLFICSLHFEESQFNRTYNWNTLRDDAVPTLFDVPSSSQHVVRPSRKKKNTSQNMPPVSEPDPLSSATHYVDCVPDEPVRARSQREKSLVPVYKMLPISEDMVALCETGNVQEDTLKYLLPAKDTPTTSATSETTSFEEVLLSIDPTVEKNNKPIPSADQPSSSRLLLRKKPTKKNRSPATDLVTPELSQLEKLERIYEEQKKKINSLNQKVYSQARKIGRLEDILKQLNETR